MKEQFERTARIIGESNVEKLTETRILIFGVGGVGSYAAEGLARAGVGDITLVDKDTVDITNINRQIPALHSTLGKPKVSVMADRIRDINPHCRVEEIRLLFMPETEMDFTGYDYIIDAIDMVKAKVEIISRANAAGIPVISSMGTGNKMDPAAFKITAIEKTGVCPLARVMRRALKDKGISDIKVLYSEEEPTGRGGSISFVPPVAGLMIAGEVVKDLINWYND
ncbi:MAG: tRNA threonylcarbamoyladenosine dehydratase [Lentihominibacter sp.]|jgi:tRNA A37 threonylcarbamoyladenosine dehydratase